MFWVVAYRSEYAPSARLSLRVLRTRSLGATADRCLVTVTPERQTSPVLLFLECAEAPKVARSKSRETFAFYMSSVALPSKLRRIVATGGTSRSAEAQLIDGAGTAEASSGLKRY
jgi:hypothetical protein